MCRAIKRLNLSREEKQREAYKPKPTLFEAEPEKYEIKYTRIRIATPRHNGKVER